MSHGLCCDNCGDVLVVNERGDDPDGESAAWLKLITGFTTYDLCSRACVVAFVESSEFIAANDEWVERVVGVANAIKEANEEDASEADDDED